MPKKSFKNNKIRRPYSTNGELVSSELWIARQSTHKRFLKACHMTPLSPSDWRNIIAQSLGLPSSKAHVRYFSADLCRQVEELLREVDEKPFL